MYLFSSLNGHLAITISISTIYLKLIQFRFPHVVTMVGKDRPYCTSGKNSLRLTGLFSIIIKHKTIDTPKIGNIFILYVSTII